MTLVKSQIDFIYQNILLFHFKTLSLWTLNERLKNTLYLSQSLLTVISFLLLLSSISSSSQLILTASQCCISFLIMYARTHTHRRVFPYFFFKPCYTHFISIGRWGYHLLHHFVYHTQNRKVSFLYTNMIVFTIITVNFAFECKFKINY